MSVFDELIGEARRDLDARRAATKDHDRAVRDRARRLGGEPPHLADALAGGGVRVIAEIKRSAPSAGSLVGEQDDGPVWLEAVVRQYESSGARAVSVLTHSRFGGSLEDLERVRNLTDLPLLRKDFVVDPVQVFEARLAGASAVLLVVKALERLKLETLAGLARDLGMEPLFEVHDAADCTKLRGAGARLVGVNNRNLADLSVDLAACERLAPLVASFPVRVAESGIETPADVIRAGKAGYQAVLVGSALMRSSDRAALLESLVDAGKRAS